MCAEAVALGRALLEGDGQIDSVVAVRHPKPDEVDRELAVVSPCGACREMFLDHCPDALVIMHGPGGADETAGEDTVAGAVSAVSWPAWGVGPAPSKNDLDVAGLHSAARPGLVAVFARAGSRAYRSRKGLVL